MEYKISIRSRECSVKVSNDAIYVDGSHYNITEFSFTDNNVFSFSYNNRKYTGYINQVGDEKFLSFRGKEYLVTIQTERESLLNSASLNNSLTKHHAEIKANMPGMVVKVLVTERMSVAKGQTLLILEAMKMENELRATTDGIVQSIHVAEKQIVEKGDLMVVIN